MKAAIYSRKSKFTGKGESVENQIELCKSYAKNNGYDDIYIYEDEGFSGGNINRPEFKSMMKDAAAKKFDAIICYRLDRISRNVSDFSSLIDELKVLGIDFISIREQFDTSSPMGTAMMFISSVFAQLERETIAERIKDNMYELAKTGRWLGGTPPFGFSSEPIYYLDNNSKQKKMMKLSPINEEISLVKLFFEQYLTLGSLGKLQKYLIQNDIKTKRNSAWDIKALQLLLRNPVYVKSSELVISYLSIKGATVFGNPNGNGILSYNKKDSKDKYKDISEWILSVSKHEGVIDDNLWIKVQRQLDKNKDLAPRLVNGSEYGVFNSVLHCAKCGGKMIQKQGHVSRKTGEILRYYICINKINSSDNTCDSKNIRLDKLEKSVMKELFKATDNKGSLIKAIEEYKKFLESEAVDKSSIKSYEKQISQKELQVKNLIDKLSLNPNIYYLLSSRIEELNKEIKELKFKKFELENTNSNLKAAIKEINASTSMLLNFKKLWENADYSMRKLLINSFVDYISYNSDTQEVVIKPFCTNKKKGAL
ncbi:recombinase family protein [Clostridium beijerinckii]|uniref:recombinase family protein n=1 Tax=Clostridium beijerinckii TaxID=1520 RepID=UPI001570CD7E|nr:recombinase family protein [Clostridium beijerinckii]NRT70002.1 DNA invertase Pin-like site-specific DNA recombinase [Clostridium beijerinckii]NRT75510.1 DNA invertase Pin-like site-specific DNA recombinase [Clostridium beijerinckii]